MAPDNAEHDQTPASTSPRIVLLVMEPEEDLGDVIDRWFEGSGFRPLITRSTEETIRVAGATQPALISFEQFCDHTEGGVGLGCAFLDAIRAHPGLENIPVVVTSWRHVRRPDPIADRVESLGGFIRYKGWICSAHHRLPQEILRAGSLRRICDDEPGYQPPPSST
jgi:CheY-like chemotaxis protein